MTLQGPVCIINEFMYMYVIGIPYMLLNAVLYSVIG